MSKGRFDSALVNRTVYWPWVCMYDTYPYLNSVPRPSKFQSYMVLSKSSILNQIVGRNYLGEFKAAKSTDTLLELMMFQRLRDLESLELCPCQDVILAGLVAKTDSASGLENIMKGVSSALFRYGGILKLDKIYNTRDSLENIHALRKTGLMTGFKM